MLGFFVAFCRLNGQYSCQFIEAWRRSTLTCRGRVEEGRGGLSLGNRSVSLPRSSNRTCGFPASGSPTGFTAGPTTGLSSSCRRSLVGSVWRFVVLLGSSPIASPQLRHKHARSEDPSLHRSYPASTVLRSSPTPVWPAMLAMALGRTRPGQASPDNPHCLASVLCPLPRRIGTGAYIRFPSLLRAAFPVTQSGQHPHRYFRGLLRLHSRYGPLARSVAQGDLCHKAPTCSVTQASRLSATRSNRLLSRWNLPPLATRAYGAHWVKAHRAEQRYWHGPSRAFAHAVRPRRLTAWAKSRAVSAPRHQLRQATLPTLRRFHMIHLA